MGLFPNRDVRFTIERKAKFLELYAINGLINKSARGAGVCPGTVGSHRESDPDFAQAMKMAKQDYYDTLEEECRSRAIRGWQEPVFQGGMQVGTKLRKSDRLLELMMKAKIAEYRDKTEIDMTVSQGAIVVPSTPATSKEWEEQQRGTDNG